MAKQFLKFLKYLSKNHTRIKKHVDTICKNKKLYGLYYMNFTKKAITENLNIRNKESVLSSKSIRFRYKTCSFLFFTFILQKTNLELYITKFYNNHYFQ